MVDYYEHPALKGVPKGNPRKGWPSIIFAILVAAGAVYSFTPRPLPDFPETQLQADQLLVNGLTKVGGRYVAVGARSRVLLAENPQGPWTDAESVSGSHDSTMTRVRTVNDGTLFALGHNLLIARSDDGGDNWQTVHVDTDFSEPLLDLVVTADGQQLIAFGGFGQVLVSEDGGDTWVGQMIDEADDSHLNAGGVSASGTIVVAGERGLMLRSTDDGRSWTVPELDYPGSMFGVIALGDERWLTFGMQGKAFLSEDDGASWQEIDTGTGDSLFGGTQLDDGRVVLVGAMRTVLVSGADLQSFRKVTEPEQGTFGEVLPVDGNAVLAAGDPGARYITLELEGMKEISGGAR